MRGSCNVAQIEKRDAKEHPDCKNLPKLLLNLLEQGWVDRSADKKSAIGLLWAPCLTALEVEALFASEPLSRFRGRVRAAVTLWAEAQLVKHGEGACSHATRNHAVFRSLVLKSGGGSST